MVRAHYILFPSRSNISTSRNGLSFGAICRAPGGGSRAETDGEGEVRLRHPIGAVPAGDGACRFRVWAPRTASVEVEILSPSPRVARLAAADDGYHDAVVAGVGAGARYRYRLDGNLRRPDPASRFQPEGVHGPSEVVDPTVYAWRDGGWPGVPLARTVLYELHVGTFTPEGTFAAVVPLLDGLRDLGVTTIELMPVAQFPGGRNWGYDGVYPFAVQDTYGGPEQLRRLVDECHARGLAVAMDVVYNHLGPEGCYVADFGPYFADRYRTPWGKAMNFDGPDSDPVRDFFLESARCWVDDFHVDMLRVDAIHGIVDTSARPFLAELTETVRERAAALGRHVPVVAESDLNDVRILRAAHDGGLGFDGQWSDDFHHALHGLLTGERHGYYEDFGAIEHLRKACAEGFVYSGGRSRHRRRRHGSSSAAVAADRLVVFAQNHDQVGNRRAGDRLAALVSPEALKLAAGAVLLSPFVPLLFMGEEYGETAPFLYFVSHSDADLIEAVRRGRREEFAAFGWEGDVPDPQDEATFAASRLDRRRIGEERHRMLRDLHAELLGLRREVPALARPGKENLRVGTGVGTSERVLWLERRAGRSRALVVLSFAHEDAEVEIPRPPVPLVRRLDSAAARWLGPGQLSPERLDPPGDAGDDAGAGASTVRIRMRSESFVLYT